LLTFVPRQGRAQALPAASAPRSSGVKGTQTTAGNSGAKGTQAPSPISTPKGSRADSTINAAFSLLDSVFNRSSFLFETVGSDIPADMQPIFIRFFKAITVNQQWFNEYRNKYSGQPLPYDPRFGITADEYRRLRRLESAPPALTPIDSQTVTVQKDAGLIHFEGSNKDEHFLDYLFIDPAHHLLGYGGDTIPYIGRAISDSNSLYGQWQGFSWHLEKVDAPAVADTTLLTAHVVEVNIGIPPQGKKTFIRISYQNIQAGSPTNNMELLGYIH
jgi:hypothetical protein